MTSKQEGQRLAEEEPTTRERLQEMYDDLPGQTTPRELPKIMIGGEEYYVDGRLHEIRSVDDPSDWVTFDEIDMMDRFAEVVKRNDMEAGE